MQKLKKALKKLAGLGKTKPAQAAKKAPASKKKTQPVAAAKKAAAKKPAPIKKAAAVAPVKKAAPTKKAAPVKAAAPIKAGAKAAAPAKPIAKTPEKPSAKAVAPAKKAAAPAPAKTELKKKKTEAEVAPEEAVESTAAAKSSKIRKSDEARAAELSTPPEEDEEIVLTDADGRRYCRVKDCDQIANVDSYCRYHYLLFWKNIQNRKKILSEGKLERYVEELTARYPDKFLDLLRKDLRSEKDFTSAIQELEIDEGADGEFEDEAQSYLDEVRGMGGGAEPSGREEEDF